MAGLPGSTRDDVAAAPDRPSADEEANVRRSATVLHRWLAYAPDAPRSGIEHVQTAATVAHRQTRPVLLVRGEVQPRDHGDPPPRQRLQLDAGTRFECQSLRWKGRQRRQCRSRGEDT